MPSGGRPLLKSYRNLYQKCWAPLPAERPILEQVIRIIHEIFDDFSDLESVALVSPGSLPPAHHSAPTCIKCLQAADLTMAPPDQPSPIHSTCTIIQPGQLSKPSALDVSHSAPTRTGVCKKFSSLTHDNCQPSQTYPNFCGRKQVFMEHAPAPADSTRPEDKGKSPSTGPPCHLPAAHNYHQLSMTTVNLCNIMPDVPQLTPATSLLIIPPGQSFSLPVPFAMGLFQSIWIH